MQIPYFFGYGSLVNRATHNNQPCACATAIGWRCAWVATPDRAIAYLTAVPDADGRIDGLIAPVQNSDWAALDTREAAYERCDATHQMDHNTQATSIAIYSIAPHRRLPPSDAHPILLSYLDVVIQGYLAEFGPDGPAHFFATTDGWQAPVLDDRDAPRYPRATVLTAMERRIVDDGLRRVGAR